MQQLNLQTIKDKIKQIFQTDLLTDTEINIFINFLVDEFAFQFPYLKAIIIKNDSSATYITNYNPYSSSVYIAIDKLDPEYGVSDIIGYIPKKTTQIKYLNYYLADTSLNQKYLNIHESIAIRIYSEYSDVLGNIYNLIKPNRFTLDDQTNIYGYQQEVIVIPKSQLPSLLFYYSPRFLNHDWAAPIEPRIYQILEAYIIYKFVDFLYFENLQQSIDSVVNFYSRLQGQFDRYIQQLNTDTTSFVYERSISIGEISISFDNISSQINQLTDIISKLADLPTKISTQHYKTLEKFRDEQFKKFKRKKFLYYSGQLNSSL